jgi:hypothetical protein
MARIRTMDFDAVAAAAPLDKTASVVRDSSGDLWDAKIHPSLGPHWKAPPEPIGKRPHGLPDLTGRAFGRFTVYRYYGKADGKNAEPKWIVRCQCGDYEARRTDSILKNTNPDACCWACEQVNVLRRRAAMPNTMKARAKSAAMLEKLAGADA